MTTTYGTANFRSIQAAERYYAQYRHDDVRAVVQQKLEEGEIHIGAPRLRPDQTFYWNTEGRAIIRNNDAS